MAEPVGRKTVHDELEAARVVFHRLLETATSAEMRGASDGTRWTNQQLLFHMLFGYLIARVLLVLARLFARLPAGASKGFARLLNAVTRPFDAVNYHGSRVGARFFGRQRTGAQFDRVIASVHRRLNAETDARLSSGMHYPVRWDPFFKEFMTLVDIYHYPTQHFDFHQQQLTLSRTG
jgi:hypothetical protein